ncbi:hypothetical protein PhCBS80983_g04311 [Powellomyces hirtus]|uniref:Cytochrome b5 heme-binding domain-containing protein n=1 Tax=Powellomyces hirtus TaxID=109895 RepID=A0A507DZ24_9FUNG|nr:hypothetical protein PhCBS80983_g04311 [Powellomyces hirtus]
MTDKAGRLISYQELQRHSTKDDCWLLIHGKVYDLTAFLDHHPDGKRIILKETGMCTTSTSDPLQLNCHDATEAFAEVHSEDVISRTLPPSAYLGILDPKTYTGKTQPTAATPAQLLARAEKILPLSQILNL